MSDTEAGAAFRARIEELAHQQDGLTKKDGSLNLAELIRRTGKDRGRWLDWFAGERTPNLSSLERPARVLETTPEYLREPFAGLPADAAPQSLTQVLIAEQRTTQQLLREVLLTIAHAPRSTEPLEEWAGEERRKHEGTPTQLPISDPARHAQE